MFCVFNLLQQCTVHLANGKLVCKSEKFSHEQEVKGNEMVEVSDGKQWFIKC